MSETNLKNVEVKCDKCDWQTSAYVPDWFNKNCPKCQDCVIITEEDLAVWNTISFLVESGLASREPTDLPHLMVKIDTAKLRK